MEIERERRNLWERTQREIDAIIEEHHRELPREEANAIAALYSRYSTQHQDSVPDQVREICKEAVNLRIHVPRELVFFDLAVRGFKKNRQGLNQLEDVLARKVVNTLLLFSTSRIFRKRYRTLEFVDRVHRGWDIRCIFVKSGVDTDDRDRWETLLNTLSLIDQFVVTMHVESIRAAHLGQLQRRVVFGTLSFGYCGEPIEGEFTKRGLPRCHIVIDDEEAEIVRLIFRWYVEDGLSIDAIIRKLNDIPDVPLPPRSTNGEWTRLSARGVLKNARYRGLWRYGVTESVYVPDGD